MERNVSNIKLKNVDKKLADLILGEIVDSGPRVDFTDVGQYNEMEFCCCWVFIVVLLFSVYKYDIGFLARVMFHKETQWYGGL